MDLIRLVLAVQVGPDVGGTGRRWWVGVGLSSQVQIGMLCSCFNWQLLWCLGTLLGYSMRTPNCGLVWEAPETDSWLLVISKVKRVQGHPGARMLECASNISSSSWGLSATPEFPERAFKNPERP